MWRGVMGGVMRSGWRLRGWISARRLRHGIGGNACAGGIEKEGWEEAF